MDATDANILKDMGARIMTLRKRIGMTQEELAEKAGVSSQFISYVESGKRSVRSENLYRISRALHVSSDYIMTGVFIDADYLPLIEKAQRLSPELLKLIENLMSQWLDQHPQD